MDTAIAVSTVLTTGIFKLDEKYRFPCLLYEKEQDLMTEVHTKFIKFAIPGASHLLLTHEQVLDRDVVYRIIETDAFRLKREYDNSDFLEAISRGQGNTKSCLLMDERMVVKMFEKNLAELISITPFSEEQVKMLDTIKVPHEINYVGIDAKTAGEWGEQKSEAEKELATLNLSWNDYCQYRYDVAKIAQEISWLEEKKICYRYGI